jgi:hypothetical protein
MPTGHEGFDRAVVDLEHSIEERNRELEHLRSINADLMAAMDRAAAEKAEFVQLLPRLDGWMARSSGTWRDHPWRASIHSLLREKYR